jgi:hypothetical protein
MKAAANKTKQWIAIVLVIVAIFTVARSLLSNGGGEQGPAPVATSAAKGQAEAGEESLDPRLHLDLLASSEAVKYAGAGKNIFRSTSEVEIPPVKVPPLLSKQQAAAKAAEAAQKAAIPPPPPPIDLKFFGFSNSKGETPKAFLSQGDNIWIAHEGDVVNRRYKIVHISPAAVDVEDLLNNNQQSIRLTQG